MKILENYYISLERVPERRFAWFGYQEAQGFRFSTLRICYAVDRMKYRTNNSICQVMMNAGLSYAKQGIEEPDRDVHGLKAYHASFMIATNLVRQKTEEGWYIVWEADCALRVPYYGIQHLCETAPKDAQILCLHGDLVSNKYSNERYVNREFAADSFFYKGVPGSNCAKVVAMTPSGAQQIVDMDASFFPRSQFDAMLTQDSDKFTGIYTSYVPVTMEPHFTGIASTLHRDITNDDGIDRRNMLGEVLHLDEL